MIHPRRRGGSRRSFLALGIAVALPACGGGDGSQDSVVVVPPPSPTPAPTPAPSPTATPVPPPITGAGANPADQTVRAGQSALFSTRSAGSEAFQWFRNGVAIAGATGSSYRTPSIVASDDGALYTVQVRSGGGTQQSAPATLRVNPNADGSGPAAFWGDLAAIPVARRVATLRFVNRTNGRWSDDQLWWRLQGRGPDGTLVNELHTFADAPTFDMPPIGSARMYFFAGRVGTGETDYYDFVELNAGRDNPALPYTFNVNTTRVDAFGLKTAIRLRCAALDQQRGEDYGTFLEDRSITFAKYLAEVPTEFQATGTLRAPYRIVEPGRAGFGPGGAYQAYWRAYVDQVYAANGIDERIVPKPTAPLNFPGPARPDLEAAIARHVAERPGTFRPDGTLTDGGFWRRTPASSFYRAAPANFYASYWHSHGIGGYAYGFPYDDVGGYSSYLSCQRPDQLLVAIGW